MTPLNHTIRATLNLSHLLNDAQGSSIVNSIENNFIANLHLSLSVVGHVSELKFAKMRKRARVEVTRRKLEDAAPAPS